MYSRFTRLSAAAILVSAFTQLYGQNSVDEKTRASYLDPLLIDILAFSVAVFLIIEGLCCQIRQKDIPVKGQITRAFRVAVGFAILTIHTIQCLHK